MQAAKINWDCSAVTPTEAAEVKVVTGISAPKPAEVATDGEKWTVDELKVGKPMMVYYFIPVDAKEAKPTEPNYKFARKAEVSAFQGDTVERINKGWIAKKSELDAAADLKLEKNQARIEFWSFTGKKIDVVAGKNQQALNPSDFESRLKDLEKKNRDLCTAEIKRINAEIERRKKQDATSTASAK